MDQDAGPKVRNLKNMDDDSWEVAKAAAARSGETIGEWLSRAAHQLAQLERGDRVILPGQPAHPGRTEPALPAPAPSFAPVDWHDLGAVLGAMAAAGVPVQRRVGRQVNALLAHQLQVALPSPQRRPTAALPSLVGPV